MSKRNRSTGSTHSDVWSASSDGDLIYIQKWTNRLRSNISRVSQSLSSRNNKTSRSTTIPLMLTIPSKAQRKLQSGSNFVVTGRPGDGGGSNTMPLNVEETEIWSGWTPLMCAAAGGHYDIVELLLAANASVITISKDEAQVTAGHLAAKNGRLQVLQRLVAIEPKVVYCKSSTVNGSKTPLHMACDTNRINIVNWLLDSDASEDHKLVSVITEDDEIRYEEKISELLAAHRKTHTDAKFIIRAKVMRASLGF